MNERKQFSPHKTDNLAGNAFRISIGTAVFLGILAIIFQFVLDAPASGNNPLTPGAQIGIPALAALFSALLAYRRRPIIGIWVLLSVIYAIPLMAVYFSPVNSLLIMGITLVLSSGLVSITLSGKSLNWALGISLVVALIMLLIGFFSPHTTVVSQASDNSIYVALPVLLTYGFFIIRQFRNYSLRIKLIAGFVFIGLIGAAFAYGTAQFATEGFTEDALPRQQAFGRIAWQTRSVQAEALEFLNSHEPETLEELTESIDELAISTAQVIALADDPDEADDFAGLAENANEIANVAQALVALHEQTLAALETLETAEEGLETLLEEGQVIIDAEIAQNIADLDIEELEEDSIPARAFLAEFGGGAQVLLAETLAFLTTDEFATLEEFEISKERLATARNEIGTIFEVNEPGEADLISQFENVALEIEAAGQAVIDSHTQTLALLETLEDTEAALDSSLITVEQLITLGVSASVATTHRITITAVIMSVIISAGLGTLVTNFITQSVSLLVDGAEQLGAGDLSVQVRVETEDEIGTLATAFNDMAARLQQTLGQLEGRARQMETSAEISRRLSTILDEQELVTAVVNQLQQAFNYYHVHIYLLNQARNSLVIAGGTGEAGKQLLGQNHAIAVGRGLVGNAAGTNTTILVSDVAQNEEWVANPLLPDTRSEIAVPIAIGDEVLGILDVQSNETDGLGQQDQELLQSITNQIAIALQNARQYNKVQRSQLSIQERETLLHTIIDSTPDWIFVKDMNHRYLSVNKAFADSFHMIPSDFIGKNDLEIGAAEEIIMGNPEKNISGLWAVEREVMESGETKIIDEEATNLDGQVFVKNTVRVPLQDLEGQISGIVGFVHDITNRKQIEKELQEAQVRTQEILESINVPLVISRVSDGIVAYVNEPLAEIIRLPREQLIGQVTPDFYYNPADRETYLTGLREKGQVSNFDLRLKRGDGEPLWTLVSGRVINFQGEPAIISSLIDISSRREAQATVARRAAELETVAEVSTVVTTILEPEVLLKQVVDLTKERFNLYHAHLYLLNESKTDLVLTSGAGEIGATMVAEGRRIKLTQERSLVARAARSMEGVVINDVQAEPGFLPHPLLPETRAEMAVPLIAGNEALGVLDVQANGVNRFTAEDINIFTALASQVASAIQNARRYDESQRAFEELTRLQRIMVREGWEDYLTTQERPLLGYSFNLQGAKPIQAKGGEVATAVETGGAKNGTKSKTAVITPDSALAIPIAVRGQLIGQIGLRNPDGSVISERKQSLLKTVAHQVSEALERARLTEQTQQALTQAEKRSQEMAIINEIVTQISTSLDLQHSMQIIVDELATAVNVDQVRIALIQPDKQTMLVIAEHYDLARTDSALGLTLPLKGNELTLEVINTRQMVVIEDAQNNPRTEPVHDLFRLQGIETVILLPLIVNDEVIGTVGLDILDKRPVYPASLKLAETIVFQTATAIQNARLFEQIQSALAETEMLYSYSSQLNTATSLDAVLDSAAAPGFQVGANNALLLVYDRNTVGNPEYGQVTALAPKDSGRVGERLYLPEQPIRHLWPSSGQNTVFVGDVWADDRLSPQDKEAFAQQNNQALAIMYLTVGNLRLGQIIIYWNKQQTFTNADERLYGAIAQQASSVVYNRLLFNQTEEALSETAALYQASADLNTAQTFDQVLTSLRHHTILGQGCHQVTINFFNRPWEKDAAPEEIQVLAQWGAEPTQGPDRYKISQFPDLDKILKPDELIVFEDIASDDRISEQGKHSLMGMNQAKSFVYVPIVAAGQWIGFVSGLYAQKVSFSEEQIRRLNVLVRQAAVSLQSIRLYEQTQKALAQTEALYTGSELIVLSSTEEDILQSLIISTGLRDLDRANIFLFDEPVEDGVPRDVTAVAVWEHEGVERTVEVGTRFEVAQVPFMTQIKPGSSMTIRDVFEDPRIDSQTQQVLESFGMRSFVLYPLVAGTKWLGIVSGQSAKPLFVDDAQIRRASSLISQAAVVMQNTILFRHEQARARKEHLLREIATKVRSSSDIDTIMRTAVSEIGRTLGRRSFITLGNDQSGTGQPSHSHEENGAT